MAGTVNKALLILGGIGVFALIGYALDQSELGDEGRRLDPLIVVAERIEETFESEGARSVRQIRPGGDSVRVKAMLLDGPTVDCMVGEELPSEQARSVDGIYDDVPWACSAEVGDAELLDNIEERLAE